MEMIMAKQTSQTANREAFDALVSGEHKNFRLFSCFVNGEPASAICAIDDEQGNDSDECNVVPLCVSITDDMIITDHEGKVARGDLSS
jgi:hypothetical protein